MDSMAPAPKRIMSFDGGGIRGVFSLQIAERIEQIFREEYGRPDLVLADVVEFFAGTSTGAMIATFLAWGYPVAEIERLFLSYGRQVFSKQWFWRRLKTKYREDGVAELFQQHFREDDGSAALLGSGKLKRLLLVVVANATTGSAWPITNNPRATFNSRSRDDCNLDIPIWQLLRASTAAPTYFQPEPIAVGNRKFLFVDGGVTPYNNPSLLAVLMATLPSYNICWPSGPEALHLISIGTGGQRIRYSKPFASQIYLWNSLDYFVHGIMNAVSVNQDMLCRVLGRCLYGARLDTELGDLGSLNLLAPAEQKFSYVRYNCMMDTNEVGNPLKAKELLLDNTTVVGRLQQIGREYAQKNVRREHLI